MQLSDGSFEALSVDQYVAGSSAYSYMISTCSNGYCYTGLTADANNSYSGNGLIFEVAVATPKDLQKMAAFAQQYQIENSAEKIQQKYGLSLDRSTIVAKLAIEMKNKPSLSEQDYNDVCQQVMGFDLKSLDTAGVAQVHGDSSLSNDLINTAATTNGIGTEQARQLLNGLLSGSAH